MTDKDSFGFGLRFGLRLGLGLGGYTVSIHLHHRDACTAVVIHTNPSRKPPVSGLESYCALVNKDVEQ